jgi:hypothetical protein
MVRGTHRSERTMTDLFLTWAAVIALLFVGAMIEQRLGRG